MNLIGRDCHTTLTRLVLGTQSSRWVCRRALQQVLGTSSIRSIHTVHSRRELRYPIEDGVGDFLPPNALRTVIEWQDGLLERLNDQIRGTRLALPILLDIIKQSAGDPGHIRAFNYASLAVNNSFFLDGLKPPTKKPENEVEQSEQSERNEEDKINETEARIAPDFNFALSRTFRDVNGLKERFIASASGMVSSGWLWLVTDNQGRLAVVPTFGSGTLLVRSRESWGDKHEQDTVIGQSFDWLSKPLEPLEEGLPKSVQGGPKSSSPVSGIKSTQPKLNPNTPSRSLSSSSVVTAMNRMNPSVRDLDAPLWGNTEAERQRAQQNGSFLYPLCCLSLFEHTWMSAGLGVWGKEEYVRRYFQVLDWDKVYKIYSKFRGGSGSQVV